MLPWLLILPTALVLWAAAAAAPGFVVQQVDRQERLPWTSRRVALFARETAARLVFWALAPVGWVDAALPAVRSDRPVLLVPSPVWSRASLVFLQVFLTQRGEVVWPMRFHRSTRDLSERAQEVGEAVGRLRASTGAASVDVVAFGVGGLAVAWWIHHDGGAASVARLVSVGTPWRGTRMAVFLPRGADRETRIHGLQLEDLLPCPVPVVSVWCPDDPIVIPAESAVADERRAVAIEGVGHQGMLLSARTFHAIRTALRDAPTETA